MRPPSIKMPVAIIDVTIPYTNLDVIEMDENEKVFVRTLSGRDYYVGDGIQHIEELKSLLKVKKNFLRLKISI